MRFLNSTTLTFENVADSELELEGNEYAILSHRWGRDEDEVHYEDILSLPTETLKKKPGYTKIQRFCRLVASFGYRYAWVDTCCINQRNSSELSEAINSMYLWYSSSAMCIAHLNDVPSRQFADSEWFERGWTLQELIAPKEVLFFDHYWSFLGEKNTLVTDLSDKTKIPEKILLHLLPPSTCSVAQRFSWAANRKTTRIEDRAYSLLGLFDIYLPMIYGEREKAFLRLQQHIIQKCDDESTFAWYMDPTMGTTSSFYAPSPAVYAECGDLVQTSGSQGFSEKNGKLFITLDIYPFSDSISVAKLHCARQVKSQDHRIGILITGTSNEGEYVRVVEPHGINVLLVSEFPPLSEPKACSIHVPISTTDSGQRRAEAHGFWLHKIQPVGYETSDIKILSNEATHHPDFVYQTNYYQPITCIVNLTPSQTLSRCDGWFQIRWIVLGFHKPNKPFIWLANDSQSGVLQHLFSRALARKEPRFDKKDLKDILGTEAQAYVDVKTFEAVIEHNWLSGRALFRLNVDHIRYPYTKTITCDNRTQIKIYPLFQPATRKLLPIDEHAKLFFGSASRGSWVVEICVADGVSPSTGFRDPGWSTRLGRKKKELHEKSDLSDEAVARRPLPVYNIRV